MDQIILMQKQVITGALLLLSLTTLECQSASKGLDTGLVHTFGCWNQFCENTWYGIRSPDKIFCSRPSMACSAAIEPAEDGGLDDFQLQCITAENVPPPDIYCSYSIYTDRKCECGHGSSGKAYCNCYVNDRLKLPLWDDEKAIKDLVVTPTVVILAIILLMILFKLLSDFYFNYKRMPNQNKGNEGQNEVEQNVLKNEETGQNLTDV